MSILAKIETEGRSVLTAVEHAAAWLVGRVAQAEQSLQTLEASSPLVASAIEAGEAYAASHGVPVAAVENVGDAVLAAARTFGSELINTGKQGD